MEKKHRKRVKFKTERFTLRLSERERRMLEELAIVKKMSKSEVLRTYLWAEYRDKILKKQLDEFVSDIEKATKELEFAEKKV